MIQRTVLSSMLLLVGTAMTAGVLAMPFDPATNNFTTIIDGSKDTSSVPQGYGKNADFCGLPTRYNDAVLDGERTQVFYYRPWRMAKDSVYWVAKPTWSSGCSPFRTNSIRLQTTEKRINATVAEELGLNDDNWLEVSYTAPYRLHIACGEATTYALYGYEKRQIPLLRINWRNKHRYTSPGIVKLTSVSESARHAFLRPRQNIVWHDRFHRGARRANAITTSRIDADDDVFLQQLTKSDQNSAPAATTTAAVAMPTSPETIISIEPSSSSSTAAAVDTTPEGAAAGATTTETDAGKQTLEAAAVAAAAASSAAAKETKMTVDQTTANEAAAVSEDKSTSPIAEAVDVAPTVTSTTTVLPSAEASATVDESESTVVSPALPKETAPPLQDQGDATVPSVDQEKTPTVTSNLPADAETPEPLADVSASSSSTTSSPSSSSATLVQSSSVVTKEVKETKAAAETPSTITISARLKPAQ